MPTCHECTKFFSESEVAEKLGVKSPFCPECIEKIKQRIEEYPKAVQKKTAKRATAKDNREGE